MACWLADVSFPPLICRGLDTTAKNTNWGGRKTHLVTESVLADKADGNPLAREFEQHGTKIA